MPVNSNVRPQGKEYDHPREKAVAVITVDQCGDLLATFVGNSASADKAKELAKTIGYNDSPLFGARKKRATLVSELVMIHTALVIFSANQSFNQTTAKAVIDSFLSCARKSVFTHLEKEMPSFPALYENRMREYFPIFHQDRAPLGLSFALMKHLGLDPLKNLQSQLTLTELITSKTKQTIDVLKGLNVIGQPTPPELSETGKNQNSKIDSEISAFMGSMERFMAQTDEWPEEIKIKALTVVSMVLDGKGKEAKEMLTTIPRKYALIVLNHLNQLRRQP